VEVIASSQAGLARQPKRVTLLHLLPFGEIDADLSRGECRLEDWSVDSRDGLEVDFVVPGRAFSIFGSPYVVQIPGGTPARCNICEEARQYVNAKGQMWTTLSDLRAHGFARQRTLAARG
jgi:hypothetical protein